MDKLINAVLGIVVVAVLVAGGLLGWSYLHPPQTFVGAKNQNDIKQWQEYIDKKPNDPLGRANLGQIYIDSGDFDKGIEQLKLAVDLDPDGYTYKYKLGQAYQKKGDIDTAIDLFNQSLEKFPKGEKYLVAFELAQIYFDQGDLEQAKNFATQAVEDDSTIWNSHYLLGQIYERQGDKQKAKQEYMDGTQFNPSSEDLKNAIQRVS